MGQTLQHKTTTQQFKLQTTSTRSFTTRSYATCNLKSLDVCGTKYGGQSVLLRLFIEKDGKSILIEGFPPWFFLVALVVPFILLFFVKTEMKVHFFLYFFFATYLFVTISFENFNAAFDRSNSEYFRCELISKSNEGRGYYFLHLGQCTPPLSLNEIKIDSKFYNLLNPPASITIETRQGAFGYPFIKNYYVTK